MKNRQANLSRTALAAFEINGRLLELSSKLAKPAGLTATQWQVLGAMLEHPATQAQIARRMGITRQSVQRTTRQLLNLGLAEQRPNPDHRTAMLFAPTPAGRRAIQRIDPDHARLAEALASELGDEAFSRTAKVLERLNGALGRIGDAAEAPTRSLRPRPERGFSRRR